jgi:hypothetical protein
VAIEILQAITQHVNYLGMVRRSVAEGVQNSRCCDHHSCLFGKWYDTSGTEMVSGMANPEASRLWTEIGQLHETFHTESFTAVQRRDTDMDEALKLETAMMQRSTVMVNRLLDLDALVTKHGVA